MDTEMEDPDSWCDKQEVCFYSPTDLNVICAHCGCFTFDIIILRNQLDHRRIFGMVDFMSPGNEDEFLFRAYPPRFELDAGKSIAVTLGMHVAHRNQILSSDQDTRIRVLMGKGGLARVRDLGLEAAFHEEYISISYAAECVGSVVTRTMHSCFRNTKHDSVCRDFSALAEFRMTQESNEFGARRIVSTVLTSGTGSDGLVRMERTDEDYNSTLKRGTNLVKYGLLVIFLLLAVCRVGSLTWKYSTDSNQVTTLNKALVLTSSTGPRSNQ